MPVRYIDTWAAHTGDADRCGNQAPTKPRYTYIAIYLVHVSCNNWQENSDEGVFTDLLHVDVSAINTGRQSASDEGIRAAACVSGANGGTCRFSAIEEEDENIDIVEDENTPTPTPLEKEGDGEGEEDEHARVAQEWGVIDQVWWWRYPCPRLNCFRNCTTTCRHKLHGLQNTLKSIYLACGGRILC